RWIAPVRRVRRGGREGRACRGFRGGGPAGVVSGAARGEQGGRCRGLAALFPDQHTIGNRERAKRAVFADFQYLASGSCDDGEERRLRQTVHLHIARRVFAGEIFGRGEAVIHD